MPNASVGGRRSKGKGRENRWENEDAAHGRRTPRCPAGSLCPFPSNACLMLA